MGFFDTMTTRDLRDVQNVTGMTYKQLADLKDDEMPPLEVIEAIIWVTKRKDDPGFTLEMAQDVPFVKFFEEEIGDEVPLDNRANRRRATRNGTPSSRPSSNHSPASASTDSGT
jgi:hypothetical protein